MSDTLICIYETDSSIKADLIKSLLQSEGIESFLQRDDASGMLPQLTAALGIKILVNSNEAEDARKVLDRTNS